MKFRYPTFDDPLFLLMVKGPEQFGMLRSIHWQSKVMGSFFGVSFQCQAFQAPNLGLELHKMFTCFFVLSLLFLKQTEDFILRPPKIPKIIQEIFVAKSDAHLDSEEFTWLVLLTEKKSRLRSCMIQKHSRKLRSATPQLEELRGGVLVQLGHTLNTWKVSLLKSGKHIFRTMSRDLSRHVRTF